ncbi:Hypothetical predicted protein [Paramuricea clavata]|uniref:Uncharacterized protein n=1 Tax=Paramuricea clavata TaxID=317549 RepID=A0A6S7HSC2_PARCT|nr:Hypothetical predicted protein [Paramuricea clavata]
MSDSESDSDLAVEQYDPEDNLNAYGSPVIQPVDEEILAVAPARQNIESNRTQFCECKNTCSKRSGRKRRGYPCRDDMLACTEQCSCGTKKALCKNKIAEQATSDTNAGRNAFERHRIAVEEARQQITDFITNLNGEQKDKILLEILSNGKGSLDFAKHLVQFGGDPCSLCVVISGLDDKVQINTLVYAIGGNANDILKSFHLSEKDYVYETVIQQFASHFVGRSNVIFERARFNKRVQGEKESVIDFIEALYELAETCQFGDLKNELIRDRIVVGI